MTRLTGTSNCGRMHATAMASLTPLLLLLWGSQVQAVTIEAPSALRAAERCVESAAAIAGLDDAGPGLTVGTLAEVEAETPVPAEIDAPEATGVELRMTHAAARRELSASPAVSLTEERRLGAWAATAGLGGLGALSLSPAEAAAADRALGFGRVSTLVLGAVRREEASPAPASELKIQIKWWMALPLLPGLVALVISVRGIAKSRTRQCYVMARA